MPGRRGETRSEARPLVDPTPDTKGGGPLELSLFPSSSSCSPAGVRRHSGRRLDFKSSRVADGPDSSPSAPSPLPPRNKRTSVHLKPPPPPRLRTAEQSKSAGPAQPGQRAPAHANIHPELPRSGRSRARLRKHPPPHPVAGAWLGHGGAPPSGDRGRRRRRAPRGARYPSPLLCCPAIRARGEATISSGLRH